MESGGTGVREDIHRGNKIGRDLASDRRTWKKKVETG